MQGADFLSLFGALDRFGGIYVLVTVREFAPLVTAIILAGAAFIMVLIDRLQVLVWAGAGLLGWIAGEVISTDPAVSHYIAGFGGQLMQQIEFAASISGVLLVIAVGGLWRQLHLSRARVKDSAEVADSA